MADNPTWQSDVGTDGAPGALGGGSQPLCLRAQCLCPPNALCTDHCDIHTAIVRRSISGGGKEWQTQPASLIPLSLVRQQLAEFDDERVKGE